MINNRNSYWIYICVAVAAVALVNVIARSWFFRIDFTDSQIYSLSSSSKAVLNKLDDLLTAKVYFSDDLPGRYGNNRRFLQDILEEYAAYSGGNLRFEFYQPEDDAKLAEEAVKYGIQPVQLQVVQNDKLEIKRVHMGLVFLYEDQREVIPIVQTTTGLEYEITSKIKKMVDDQKQVIGLARFEGQTVATENIRTQLQESYRVRQVMMSQTVAAEVNLLFVSGVTDSISDDELKNLKDYIDRGGNLFLTQSSIDASLQTQRGMPIVSNLFEVLETYGVNIENNLVLDEFCNNITVTQQRGFFRINTAVAYPFFPIVRSFGDHVMVEGLEQVHLLFPSEISYDSTDSTATVRPLFTTSDRSGVAAGFFNLSPIENPMFETLTDVGRTVGVYATSKLGATTVTSQLVLISDSSFLLDDAGGRMPENRVFVLNASDVLIGDRDLVALRSREITSRPLAAVEEGARATWKSINIILPALLVILYGLLQWRLEINRTKRLEELYG
jgi:gliding-associated putative ABC transporter substrate-binding component GldG